MLNPVFFFLKNHFIYSKELQREKEKHRCLRIYRTDGCTQVHHLGKREHAADALRTHGMKERLLGAA